jgi:NADPH-dependent 7-cyano-7-deazaguanine reductase QueF
MNQDLVYEGLHSDLNPNVKESFITVGVDYSPIKNVHILPNIWYQSFSNKNDNNNNRDYDLVFRLTFYYSY